MDNPWTFYLLQLKIGDTDIYYVHNRFSDLLKILLNLLDTPHKINTFIDTMEDVYVYQIERGELVARHDIHAWITITLPNYLEIKFNQPDKPSFRKIHPSACPDTLCEESEVLSKTTIPHGISLKTANQTFNIQILPGVSLSTPGNVRTGEVVSVPEIWIRKTGNPFQDILLYYGLNVQN